MRSFRHRFQNSIGKKNLAMSQAPPPFDINRLSQLKQDIEKLNEHRKKAKTEVDGLENQCIQALVQMGIRYVDESGTGNGPFWSLAKNKTDGSWNSERYIEFFTMLLKDIQQGRQYTPAQCSELASNYLKQHEKRKLVLSKMTKAQQRGIDDLKAWVAGRDA